MKKHMPRSDGNGGVYITKPFALVTILITIVLILGQSVFVFAQLDSRVDSLEDKTSNSQDVWNKINDCESANAVLNEKIDMLVDNSKDIKIDVKELRNELNTYMINLNS